MLVWVLRQVPVGQVGYEQLVLVWALQQVHVCVDSQADSWQRQQQALVGQLQVPVGEDSQAARGVRGAAEHLPVARRRQAACARPTAGICSSSKLHGKDSRTLSCIYTSCGNTPC